MSTTAVASADRPLAVTADEELLDDLVRLAAAAGVVLDVVTEPAGVRRTWSTASLVLVGVDASAALARAAPLHRPGVVMVGRSLQISHWRHAVELGADLVVSLPEQEADLVDRLADASEGISREAATICVIGGRGGAGATTLATALAVTATSERLNVMLIDGDVMSGGIDLMLGGEHIKGLRWPDLVSTEGRVSAAALRAALPQVDELVVLSWDRGDVVAASAEAMKAVLAAARRASDLVVVDLPRHLDEAAAVALASCTTALLVVPAEVRATAAASRVAAVLTPRAPDVRLVVRGPGPAGLDGDLIAASLGLPLAAQLAPEPGLEDLLEQGSSPSPLRQRPPSHLHPPLPHRPPLPPMTTIRAADQVLLERVRTALASDNSEPTASRVAAVLRKEGRLLGDTAVLGVVDALRREIAGAGALDPLLAEPGVTDVLVHGPREVWVDKGRGLERAVITMEDDSAVRRLAQRLAAAAGRRLDDSTPYVDARLPNGSRLHAVLSPISANGTCISLRVPARRTFTLAQLTQAGSIPDNGARLLRRMVQARLAFLISGGTGTGKTTLLSAMLSLVPPAERIVLVEDSAELDPNHPHVVHLEARPPNVEGAGEITLRTLVRQALRMRPDRLVVGEVRGAEVVDLLAALNTGHEGGCGTLHANSAAEVPARLEALGVAAGLDRAAVHSQLAAAVDAVIHVLRARDGRRRIAELCVFTRTTDGLVVAQEALRFDRSGNVHEGPGMDRLSELLARREDT